MMDSLKQRILDYVSASQPAKVDLIYRGVGISRNRYYEETKELRFMGKLRNIPGIGVFPGEDAYQHWLKSGGYEEIRRCVVGANLGSREAKGVKKPRNVDDPEMFAPYDQAKNGVVAEFMQNDARKRLMMIYGRAGVWKKHITPEKSLNRNIANSLKPSSTPNYAARVLA